MHVSLVGSIEEKIYQRQVSKQGLSGTVVDLTKKGEHISFSAEEMRDLFTFDSNTSCLTHDLLDCQCSGDGKTPGKTKMQTYMLNTVSSGFIIVTYAYIIL